MRDLLTSRGATHPFVQINTRWLEVGHVDEIVALVQRGSGGFCALRASPALGIWMLEKLVAAQVSGTLVTRLFRGKKWNHENSPEAMDPHVPPRAWFRLLREGRYDLASFDKPVRYDSAYHDDRQFLLINRRPVVNARYAAMIGCKDLLDICRTTNRQAEDLFLANKYALADELQYRQFVEDEDYREKQMPFRADKILAEEFPGADIFLLPAVFDATATFANGRVSALVPGMVNFQTLGSHVAVPRPHGPRMRPAEAARFVNRLAAHVDLGLRVDEDYIRKHALDRTWHWTRAAERVNHASLSRKRTEFDPDFEQYRAAKARSMHHDPFGAAANAISPIPTIDLWAIDHADDPLRNHPVSEPEDLQRIAGYFKDGFDAFRNFPVDFCRGDTEDAHPRADAYAKAIIPVMDAIRDANPGIFDADGRVLPKAWTRIAIPENTVDVFELYAQALFEWIGVEVHWVDSWHYHTHKGGIHCGTNVLRKVGAAI